MAKTGKRQRLTVRSGCNFRVLLLYFLKYSQFSLLGKEGKVMWHKKKTRKLARRSTGVVHSFVKLVAKKENDEKI